MIDLKAIRAAAEADKGQDRAFILLSVDILTLLDRLEAAEKDAARIRNEALEEAAQLCDRFQERHMQPAECAGAIRMMK